VRIFRAAVSVISIMVHHGKLEALHYYLRHASRLAPAL
jgi:hypothetical protein